MAAKGSDNPRRAADEPLALALARGLSVQAAAAEAGVSERTAHRRLSERAFCERVEEVRRLLVDGAVRNLSARTSAASDRLAELTHSNNEAVSLGACKAVLDLGFRAHGQRAVVERLDELERRLAQGGTLR
jgi:hypothetical protein